MIQPISDISIDIDQGEILAVLGASGAGKSLLAHAILGILPGNARCGGEIFYRGELLTTQEIGRLRGREISFIPQSVNYLDPLMTVGRQVRIGLEKKTAKTFQKELFEQYGLEQKHAGLFPHELSGGMLRRVLFATSVRKGVRLVIADEPTPGIHPSALSEILKQLARFAKQGAGVMLITHDITAALRVAHKVAVVKDGRSIEVSEASAFQGKGRALKTAYAQRLWRALPQNDFHV